MRVPEFKVGDLVRIRKQKDVYPSWKTAVGLVVRVRNMLRDLNIDKPIYGVLWWVRLEGDENFLSRYNNVEFERELERIEENE